MKILLNDNEVIFPTSLSQITLGQRIAFQNQHGNELDAMLDSILKMPEGFLKKLEEEQFIYEKMCRTFAFFAGTTVEAVKESEFLETIMEVYYSCLAVLFEDEANQELQKEFSFNGEIWEIPTVELEPNGKMKFGEFIDAKQMLKDQHDLATGKWDAMLRLCAVYLRRKGEAYKEEFLWEGSDRMELMKQLPMDIAMQVGFFLTSTMNFSINTLRSSGSPVQKEVVSM